MQYSEEYLVVHLIINWLVIKGGAISKNAFDFFPGVYF